MQMFVIINRVGIIINADVNVNNWVIKANVMMGLFVILVNVNVNVINHAMQENIWIKRIVHVEKEADW